MENDLDLSSIMVGYDEAPNAPVPAETSKKSDVPKPTSADANDAKNFILTQILRNLKSSNQKNRSTS